VSYFRFSAFNGGADAFGGGNGVLKAAKLDDAASDFVKAATNEGLEPAAIGDRCRPATGNLDGDWTAADMGRTTPGTDKRCCITICICCDVMPAACIARVDNKQEKIHHLLDT